MLPIQIVPEAIIKKRQNSYSYTHFLFAKKMLEKFRWKNNFG